MSDTARLRFKIGEAFPADDLIARWVMNLSIALADLRLVGPFVTRDDQPANERIYFVRLFASHLREVAKLVALDYRKKPEVRAFVDSLPDEAREARDRFVADLEADRQRDGESYSIFTDLKRLRDDTFHYATDQGGPSSCCTRFSRT